MAELKGQNELSRLSDNRLFRENAYVDGRWCTGGGDVQTVSDPATGRVIGAVPMLGEADTKEAILAAERAFVVWRALLPQDRAKRIRAWYDEICAAKEDLAVLMTLEQGKPLTEAREEIDYAASFVEWYAEEAKRVSIESVTGHLPGADLQVWREPIGVFNVVTGRPAEIVDTLCSDTKVRALSFTGSTEIGRLIARNCADTIKTLVLELSGHAPFIVFDDAELDKAVESAVPAKFATSGQDCLAANRISVARPVYETFLERFACRVATLKVGREFESDTDIGPLIHERAVKKVERHIADAVEKGARLLTGGHRPHPNELFFEPTVLADVPLDALIMQEETFGPVAAVAPFDGEDEVIRKANGTDYGLVAYVHTRNYARICRVTKALEFGMVAVNRTMITGAPIPFGGVKQSGLGREGSRLGLEAFTEVKYVCLDCA